MVYHPHYDFYFLNLSSVTFLKLALKILNKDLHTFYLNKWLALLAYTAHTVTNCQRTLRIRYPIATKNVHTVAICQRTLHMHTLILLQKKLRYKQLKNEQIFLICKYKLNCYQYLIMKQFGLLIPKYIFVQYQYLLFTKFGPLIQKCIFVL